MSDSSHHPDEEPLTDACAETNQQGHDDPPAEHPEESLRAVLTKISDIILHLDRAGNILDINRVLPGYDLAEVIGSSAFDYQPPESSRKLRAALLRVFERQESVTYQALGHGLPGEFCWYLVRLSPILSEGVVQSALLIASDITEQREIDERLRQRERLILNIGKAAPLIIYLFDLQSRRPTFVSPRVETDLGYTLDELKAMGSTLIERLVHPEDLRRFPEIIDRWQYIEDGRLLETQLRLRHADGRWRRFATRDTVFSRDEGGRPKEIVGTAQDVTDQWRDEVTLRHLSASAAAETGEGFFRSLVTHLADVLDVDYALVGAVCPGETATVQTMAVYMDGQIGDNFVYELPNTPCREVVNGGVCVYPDHVREKFPLDQLLVEMGVESYAGISLTGSSGQPLGLISVMDRKPLASASGVESLLHVFGQRAAAELERLQAEQALRDSESRYRTLFENAPIGLGVADEHGNLLDFNNAMLLPGGYAREDIVKIANVARLYADADARSEALALAARQGFLRRHEVRFLRKDGTAYDALLSLNRVTVDGKTGWQAMVQDITEQKQAAREREELIRELEAKNAELERFTYTVSHDLKSPLVTIKGFLGMLQQSADGGDLATLKQDIQRIGHAADQMKHLLDDLLGLSRVGRIVNPPEEVPLGELARQAAELLMGRLRQNGVHVSIAADLPTVHADRSRLLEVFQNLIENAAKFMGEQPQPQVEIGAHRQDDEVVCWVRDNGIGIEPQYREQIFRLFEQLQSRQDGTGIGLTIAKRIVEVHGGRMWVESEGIGQGATFYFTLPVAR